MFTPDNEDALFPKGADLETVYFNVYRRDKHRRAGLNGNTSEEVRKEVLQRFWAEWLSTSLSYLEQKSGPELQVIARVAHRAFSKGGALLVPFDDEQHFKQMTPESVLGCKPEYRGEQVHVLNQNLCSPDKLVQADRAVVLIPSYLAEVGVHNAPFALTEVSWLASRVRDILSTRDDPNSPVRAMAARAELVGHMIAETDETPVAHDQQFWVDGYMLNRDSFSAWRMFPRGLASLPPELKYSTPLDSDDRTGNYPLTTVCPF